MGIKHHCWCPLFPRLLDSGGAWALTLKKEPPGDSQGTWAQWCRSTALAEKESGAVDLGMIKREEWPRDWIRFISVTTINDNGKTSQNNIQPLCRVWSKQISCSYTRNNGKLRLYSSLSKTGICRGGEGRVRTSSADFTPASPGCPCQTGWQALCNWISTALQGPRGEGSYNYCLTWINF